MGSIVNSKSVMHILSGWRVAELLPLRSSNSPYYRLLFKSGIHAINKKRGRCVSSAFPGYFLFSIVICRFDWLAFHIFEPILDEGHQPNDGS